MLKIVRVKPTVGKADVYAVTVKDENAANLHQILQPYVNSVYGQYASIEYQAQFAVPVVDFSEYKVTMFIDADHLAENMQKTFAVPNVVPYNIITD